MKQTLFFTAIILSLLSSSCITNKDVVYLQDKGTVANDSIQIQELNKPYRVQVNDILSIDIKSTDSELEKLIEIFQPTENSGNAEGQQALYFRGFTAVSYTHLTLPTTPYV